MLVCPACCTQLPDGSRFCLSCGAAVAPTPAAREERKVVTTLFCDLVGFTSLSELADPEDVGALLSAYHQAARSVIGAWPALAQTDALVARARPGRSASRGDA
jgi:hypothetical protein